MGSTKYEFQRAELEVAIDPAIPTFGRLTVSLAGKRAIYLAKREDLERLSRQISEQLTKASLRQDHL
jgi:hypothetical protein